MVHLFHGSGGSPGVDYVKKTGWSQGRGPIARWASVSSAVSGCCEVWQMGEDLSRESSDDAASGTLCGGQAACRWVSADRIGRARQAGQGTVCHVPQCETVPQDETRSPSVLEVVNGRSSGHDGRQSRLSRLSRLSRQRQGGDGQGSGERTGLAAGIVRLVL